MGNLKSLPGELAFYLDLVSAMYRDIAQRYAVTSKVQAIELGVIRTRCLEEGLPFLTVTLPRLGKAVDTALSTGARLSISGFQAGDGVLPKFIGWLLSRVFDTSGAELVNSDSCALKHIRSLCTVMYKTEIPYAKRTQEAVLEAFVKVDAALPAEGAGCVLDATDVYCIRGGCLQSDEWIRRARALVARVCSVLDPERITPRHGPGAVATGENILEKTVFSRIYKDLEVVYPFTEWMMYSLNHVAQSIPASNPRITFVDEPTAKVVLVPKDSRGPRLISCEPLEIQWIQQGLKDLLVDRIESYWLTKGRVNFADQQVNRRLALRASQDRTMVTLDMKDASDRVSLELVKTLFGDNSKLLAALLAARSSSTRLPSGTVVKLKKFAPMGSAVCFPVEALTFWALAVSAIEIDYPLLSKQEKEVYVYGDDIIVSDKVYTSLLQRFPTVGLKFNDGKCCVASSFRESCGCDAHKGVDVTPVRLRTMWSRSANNPKCLQSYAAFHNAVYGQGYFRTAEIVRKQLEFQYGVLPASENYVVADNGSYVTQDAGVTLACDEPSRRVNLRKGVAIRFNPETQYSEVETWGTEPLTRRSRHDGYAELLRRFSGGYGSHGGIYAMTRRNRLKRVWVPVKTGMGPNKSTLIIGEFPGYTVSYRNPDSSL